MNATIRSGSSNAERFGRWLGRGWRVFARQERRVLSVMTGAGLSFAMAKGLLWVARVVLLALALYVSFWLALLAAFAITAAWVARNSDCEDDEKQPEWRDGHDGFGLYDKSEWRIDMGDSDER
ncbi:DUF3742 family protein [Achromobacter pestifer]|uniref:DUF3742 family protein n=1 Tax=Achromobacter pestifer TaxID=1353889 RepID=A0A6S6Z0T3_9BURK|nr:DUF3742 family protein [Achromobacter pestifer]CAB3647623.1 hypothetical protein LMG3431_02585 [Achromobacter pestifer]